MSDAGRGEGDREGRGDALDREMMRAAIRLACESVAAGGGPFGAVVVRGGTILGRGANRVTRDNDPTAHAEVVAIRDACARLGSFRLDGCTLYTSCEPCPMCLGAIYWARPARVLFAATAADAAEAGFDDRFIYDQLALAPGARQLRLEPLLREEAQAAFAAWAAKPDRIPY